MKTQHLWNKKWTKQNWVVY